MLNMRRRWDIPLPLHDAHGCNVSAVWLSWWRCQNEDDGVGDYSDDDNAEYEAMYQYFDKDAKMKMTVMVIIVMMIMLNMRRWWDVPLSLHDAHWCDASVFWWGCQNEDDGVGDDSDDGAAEYEATMRCPSKMLIAVMHQQCDLFDEGVKMIFNTAKDEAHLYRRVWWWGLALSVGQWLSFSPFW